MFSKGAHVLVTIRGQQEYGVVTSDGLIRAGKRKNRYSVKLGNGRTYHAKICQVFHNAANNIAISVVHASGMPLHTGLQLDFSDSLLDLRRWVAKQSCIEVVGLVSSEDEQLDPFSTLGAAGIKDQSVLTVLTPENACPLPPNAKVEVNVCAPADLTGKVGRIIGKQRDKFLLDLGSAQGVQYMKRHHITYRGLTDQGSKDYDSEDDDVSNVSNAVPEDQCPICLEPMWDENGRPFPGHGVANPVCDHTIHSTCLSDYIQVSIEKGITNGVSAVGPRGNCPTCRHAITPLWPELRTKWQAPRFWLPLILHVLRSKGPTANGVPLSSLVQDVRAAVGMSEEEMLAALHGHGPPFNNKCCCVATEPDAIQDAIFRASFQRVLQSPENNFFGLPARASVSIMRPKDPEDDFIVVGGPMHPDCRIFLNSWGMISTERCNFCRGSLQESWLLCTGPCLKYVDTLYCSHSCLKNDYTSHLQCCLAYRSEADTCSPVTDVGSADADNLERGLAASIQAADEASAPFNAQVSEALLKSRHVPSGVVLIEYSRSPQAFKDALDNCPELEECRCILRSNGLHPELPSGAKMFVRPEQYELVKKCVEHWELKPRHVLVSEEYEHRLVYAIAMIPKREGIKPKKDTVNIIVPHIKLRTFVHVQFPSSLRSGVSSVQKVASTTDAHPRKGKNPRCA